MGFFFFHVSPSHLLLPLFPLNYSRNIWDEGMCVFIYIGLSLPWSPCFCSEGLFCRFQRKICWTLTLDNVCLKIGLWGTSSFMITLQKEILDVNWGGPETSSMVNLIFKGSKGRLHGPWHKQMPSWGEGGGMKGGKHTLIRKATCSCIVGY